MRLYINDLSLSSQFQSPAAFVSNLDDLLRLREGNQVVANCLFCSRDIRLRPVTGGHTFQEAVASTGDKNLIRRVLAWLGKSGPFWDENRQFNADDYFEHSKVDVTDTSLGEAARVLLAGSQANLVSFQSGGFDYKPVSVQHGLPEDVLGTILLDNEWDFANLRHLISSLAPRPVNWDQMLDQAKDRFDFVEFSESSISSLSAEPFSSCVVDRVFELCRVLNEYAELLSLAKGTSERSNEIVSKHFSGEKSWFSDESVTNKRKFSEQMKFNPIGGGDKVSCTWHGKIKSPQYRVHFRWPISHGEKIQVYYIGPKITKS